MVSVFNFETAQEHVYFANGMLVHNCDECSDADGEIVNLGEDFPDVDVDSPPAHPNCACALVPADDDLGAPDASDEDRKTAARGGYSADEYETMFGHRHPVDEDDEEDD